MWKRGSGGVLAAFFQVISRIRLPSGSDLWAKGRVSAFALRDGGDFAEREGGVGHRGWPLCKVGYPDQLLHWRARNQPPSTDYICQWGGSVRVPRPNF